MTGHDVASRLVRAGGLLAAFPLRLWEDDGSEIAEKIAEAQRYYDAITRDLTPADTDAAATVAIGRAVAASFALQLCLDEIGVAWDDDGPELGEMAEVDDDGVSGPFAERAVAGARAALDADTEDPLVPLHLGHVLTWVGDRDGAVSAYREALRREPQDADARSCLAQLGVTPAPQPPASLVNRRRYGFALLQGAGRVTNAEWAESHLVFGSVADARAEADAELTEDTGDVTREELDGWLRLTLEVHPPGRPASSHDLTGRVPDEPAGGPFRIDWSGIPVDESLEPPLPAGRLLRLDTTTYFPGRIRS